MAPLEEHHNQRQLRLISVAFKEASIDSPSFRATVNFFHTRVDIFEEWIDKSMAFYEKKYTHSYDDFKRTQNSLLSQLLPSPSMLSSGLVSNQGYTPSLVSNFLFDFTEYSERIIKALKGNDILNSTPLSELISVAIDPYKACRKSFDYYQTKYDSMLSTFQAANIREVSIDPETTKNDTIHIFTLQKSYLQASLDLIEAIYTLRLQIDKFLLDTMNNMKSDSIYSPKDGSRPLDLMPSMNDYMKDYTMWVQNAIDGARALERDIENAKKQAYEYTLSHITPSEDINDYDIRTISTNTFVDQNIHINKTPEKSGWLFMKTYVGTPSREIWVNRWCFLQNGVFGTLLLSPSKTYVEETDKFGIFLTNIRYKPEEYRKFCFEMKIFNGNNSASQDKRKMIELVFQASSLKELKSWINAFETTRKVVSQLDKNSLNYEIAYKRFSPKYIEFASSTTTKIDQQITTFDDTTESLFQKYKCAFSEYEVLSVGSEKIFNFQTIITPISTKMTNLAFLADNSVYGSYCTNAVVANIWGTTYWSDYSLILSTVPMNEERTTSKPTTRLVSPHDKIIYPKFYPNAMKFYDLQFKNLFFSIDQRLSKITEEFLLFKFDAFWCPNKKQKFASTCYLTQYNLYSFINSVGFICLTKVNLDDLVSIEKDKATRTLIRIYDSSGLQLRVNVLFTDPEAVALKLQYLLEKKASGTNDSIMEIFARFSEIDKEMEEKRNLERANSDSSESVYDSQLVGSKHDHELTFWNITKESAELLNKRKMLQKESSVYFSHNYDIPCKGLMHLLFGDESQAFPKSLFLARKNGTQHVNWYWKQKRTNKTGDVILSRKIEFVVDMTDNFLTTSKYSDNNVEELSLEQNIVKAIDNKYYEIDQTPVRIKLPFARIMKVTTKYIISEAYDPEKSTSENKSKSPRNGSCFQLFFNIDFLDCKSGNPVKDLHFLERVYLDWAIHFAGTEFFLFRKVIRFYLEKMGKHGKVIKAMRLCGLIGVSDEATNETEKHEVITEKDIGTNKDVNVDPIVDRKQYDARYTLNIISKVLLKRLVYRVSNLFFFLFRVIISLFLGSSTVVQSLNRYLLFGLLLSIIVNLYLSGRSTLNFWSVHNAEKKFNNFMSDSGKFTMQRSIKIDDLDLLTEYLAIDENNRAYNKFQEYLHDIDHDFKYKTTRKDLAVKRNELLVELRILQNMERELVQGEYKRFLLEEVDRCEQALREVPDLFTNDENIKSYCENCNDELTRVSRLLL
ncbi:uncharacterized protein HLK63_J07821 [Nakaseomyces glabratus]|nr:uncharacterized protein GW608_J07821 [Nakaseomyces glabratus]UCS27084.1 uncharacterized protein HLK63_J07821 [Nakaseomyces glabratus]UCS32313.1 uncharacterized protein HLK64_J07821 [Nakaseomyces glabratus]UCS37542.1 uncharacterized protein HLK62_J07821 [Nakaseomyces glabratus]